MCELMRYGVLFLGLCSAISHAQASNSGADGFNAERSGRAVQTTGHVGSSNISIASTIGNATCQSRVANYITHTLPQQCLRTDRVAANATQSSHANATKTDNGETVSGTSIEPPIQTSASTGENATAFTDPLGSSVLSPSSSSTISPDGTEPSPSGPETLLEAQGETGSALDNVNFLSFEEWKKQNLAKSGQSPENVAQPRNSPASGDRERPGVNNALDSLGEENEIELDFSGFGGAASASSEPSPASTETDGATSPTSQPLRSKDAGKTCKERTNYASFDCAATILKSNSECKSASSILVENKDSYMLNTCSANNKFFIVELCDPILVDTVVLANYEFFSSIFQHFRVSVSDRYPVKIDKWRDLGTFEGRNSRQVQAFLIEHPQIWARYLRIEFLSHYGGEYYCPVSLLRVHGTTMLEEYRHEEEVARGENVDEEAVLEVEATATSAIALETVDSSHETSEEKTEAVPGVEGAPFNGTAHEPVPIASLPTTEEPGKEQASAPSPSAFIGNSSELLASMEVPQVAEMTCAINVTESNVEPASQINASETSRQPNQTIAKQDSVQNIIAMTTSSPALNLSTSRSGFEPPNPDPSSGMNASETTSETPLDKTFNTTFTIANADDTSMSISASSTTATSSPTTTAANGKSTESTAATPSSSSNSTRPAATASSSVPAPPQPSTQESFFKSINKRLQQLESNSTLSLQYIEEQSRILRDAFSKVEKRQISATTTFLSNLNQTVMTELRGFRQAYDQLWQSTVIELEGQREQYQREMLALSTRLTLVADELVWQKRMGIVQSTLLLLCLALVLFARTGNGNGYLEVPLMQQMMNKSQAALGWESPQGSPSPAEGRSPVSLFRRKLWRATTEPVNGFGTDEGTDSRPGSKEGLDVKVEAPTPTSEEGALSEVDNEGGNDGDGGEAVDEEFLDVRESRSGPATPRGTRDGLRKPSKWLDGGGGSLGVI